MGTVKTQRAPAVSGHVAAALTMLVWGTTFISTKVLLRAFSPVEILLFRFLIGYLALLLVHPHFIKPKSIREELLFALAGFCGITSYYLLENTALTYTLASNVGIIISAAPLFTAVLAHFTLRTERLHASFFFGFLLAMAGVALINLNGIFCLKLNPLGDLLAAAAAAVWAVYSVLTRKISAKPYNTIACTRRTFFYGILFMIPFSLWMGVRPELARAVTGVNLFNLLFLGLGASALCFVTWNFAVGALGAVKTSVYIYLVPVITIASSALILSEHITWVALLGALLTMAGLFISEKRQRNGTREP